MMTLGQDGKTMAYISATPFDATSRPYSDMPPVSGAGSVSRR